MMETELNRLSTFANWPWNLTARPLRLARSGFFYSGKDDEVECFSCKTLLGQWRSYELLQAMHKQKSPQCNLVRKDDRENVPMKILNLNSRSFTATDGCEVDRPNPVFKTDHAGVDADKMSRWMELYRSAHSRARQRKIFSSEVVEEEIPIIDDRLNPDFDLLRKEVVRLRTFYDWPSGAHVTPEVLAREGLFYTGVEDRVRCAFCRGSMLKWEPTDIPSNEHRKHFPDCPFVRREDVNNVPMDPLSVDSRLANDQARQPSPREQSLQQMSSLQMSTEDARNATRSSQPTSIDSQDLPKYPSYRDKAERVKSFPQGELSGQSPEAMAEAGFFFAGQGDKVLCFQCGGNLKNWQPNDNPWEEHKRWYSSCLYLKTHFPSSRPASRVPQATVTGANYRVEPREIKARMDTATVRAILDMGYTRESIRTVIEDRLSSMGDDFPNAESLLDALFQQEAASGASSDRISTSSGYQTVSENSSSSSAPASSASIFANNLIPTYASSPSVPKLQILASTSSQKAPVTGHAASVMSTSEAAEDAQSKSKGKKKKNKKKKSSPAHSALASLPTAAAIAADFGCEACADSIETSKTSSENTLEDIPDEEAASYLEENRQLREARTCKVCMDSEVNTVFLPCGHLVCCNNCAPQLRNCPICRTFIRGTVKTFLS